jgi:hypothetical protein
MVFNRAGEPKSWNEITVPASAWSQQRQRRRSAALTLALLAPDQSFAGASGFNPMAPNPFFSSSSNAGAWRSPRFS